MTTHTQLQSDLRLYGIKRDLIALLGRIDDLALARGVPVATQQHLRTLASELRAPIQAILVPLCEGRQPPGEPVYASIQEREDVLDSIYPDNTGGAA